MHSRRLVDKVKITVSDTMTNSMDESGETEPDEAADPKNHTNYRDLMHEPIIMVLIGCFIALVFVLTILLICHLCSRRRKSRRRSMCSCNHPHSQFNRGYDFYPQAPPAYSPAGMYHRPEVHRCVCQSRLEENAPFTLHPRFDSMAMIPLSQSGNESQCRLTPCQERRSEPNRSSREFPLLQQAGGDIPNPVYQDSELDYTDNDRYPEGPLKKLFKMTERSFSQEVCGKLVVSVARYVDYHGDTLILDNMGISLRVPEGAVKRGKRQWITLVLNWDLSDNPQMTKEQSLVSPVVYVGPHGMKLEKPCTLVYRHCSFDPRHIRVMRSETELTDDKSWEALCDQSDKSGVCYLTSDECQLKIDKFTLYTCVQSPIDQQIGKKWLQIAVFACPLRKEINHHQIRVYFLNKTPCALQWAIQNEATFGGKLVCPEKVFLFDGGEFDMIAITKYVSEGWEMVDTDNMDKISFLKIWHGHCPHISVCYKRQSTNQNQVSVLGQGQDINPSVAIELNLNLLTYQNGLEDNGEKIFIQVAEDNITPVTENEVACRRHHIENIEINVNNYVQEHASLAGSIPSTAEVNIHRGNETNASADTNLSSSDRTRDTLRVNIKSIHCREDFLKLEKQIKPRIVPHKLRHQLAVLLDPPKHIRGNDWRALAEKLELDACIPKLETMGNKTEHLLNVIESRNISLSKFKEMLNDMDRTDCVQTIESFFGEIESESDRRPIESSESGYITYTGEHNTRRNISSQMSWEDNTRLYTNSSSITKANNNNNNSHIMRAELPRSTRMAGEHSAYSHNPSIDFYHRESTQSEVGRHDQRANNLSGLNDRNSEALLERGQDFRGRRAQFEQNNLSSPNYGMRGNDSRTHKKY